MIQRRRLGFNAGMPSEQAFQSIASLDAKGKRLWRTHHIWVTGSMMRPYKVGRLGEVILDGPFYRVHPSLWMERWGDAREGRRLNRKAQHCFAKASIWQLRTLDGGGSLSLCGPGSRTHGLVSK